MDFSGLSEEEAGFALGEKVQEYNRKFIEEKLGISFDNWYSEDKEIRASGKSDKMLDALNKKELTYEEDGALWLKTTEHGDNEDRVVLRSDGTKSYFLSDITYHDEKFSKGKKGGYRGPDQAWNCRYKLKTSKAEKSWSLEIAIPWKELDSGPKDRLYFNITRNRYFKGSGWQTYAPLLGGKFHLPQWFWPLQMK